MSTFGLEGSMPRSGIPGRWKEKLPVSIFATEVSNATGGIHWEAIVRFHVDPPEPDLILGDSIFPPTVNNLVEYLIYECGYSPSAE